MGIRPENLAWVTAADDQATRAGLPAHARPPANRPAVQTDPIRARATEAAHYFAALHPDRLDPYNGHWSASQPCSVGAHLAHILGLRAPDRHAAAGAWAAAFGGNRAHAILMLRAAGAPHDPFTRHAWTVNPAVVFSRVATLETLPPLVDADLSHAALCHADLNRADLARANLSGTDLRQACLSDADLRDADLRQAIASGADLRHADLSGARLRGADLRNASFHAANLTGADLREARLDGADMSHAALDRADCAGADLRNACLAYSSAAGAGFRCADMRRADLAGATGLEIRGARVL